MAVGTLEVSDTAQSRDEKRKFCVMKTDVLDKRFHAELNKSIMVLCDSFADRECEGSGFQDRRKTYCYLKPNPTKRSKCKCQTCTVHRQTGYLQMASFSLKFEVTKHTEHCSFALKWNSNAKQIRVPGKKNLQKLTRLKHILIYIDLLPAF